MFEKLADNSKEIPTLTGTAAERFIKKAEENLKKRGSIDFSKEMRNSLAILKKRVARREEDEKKNS